MYPIGTNLIDPDYSKDAETAAKQQEEMTAAKELCIGIEDYRPKIRSVKSQNRTMIIKATANYKQMNGYEIEYSTSKKFSKAKQKKIPTTKNSVKKTVKSLKKGGTYYVRVRVYAIYDAAKYSGNLEVKPRTYYSKWSKIKKVVINDGNGK